MTQEDSLHIFSKDTLIKGRPSWLRCVQLRDQTYSISVGPLTFIRLEDEWYEDIGDPAEVVRLLAKQSAFRADILTFWQRVPDVVPRYSYSHEWDELAVLPTKSYADWWNSRIKSRVRSQIRKAEKDGVVVRETAYDEAFVCGMTRIFNEAPMRQGRRFWHYGKNEETIKREFARHIDREHMIGAYLGDEMIGFVMLGNAGRFGITGQIISSLKHRDKAPNNVLIAKAVQVCERLGLENLVYLFWSDDSLSEFKRRCGFERTRVPRYYVPLTARGRLAMRIGAHRGWRAMVPGRVKAPLKQLRARWLEFRTK